MSDTPNFDFKRLPIQPKRGRGRPRKSDGPQPEEVLLEVLQDSVADMKARLAAARLSGFHDAQAQAATLAHSITCWTLAERIRALVPKEGA